MHSASVAILGCGPAGLLAAHAARWSGVPLEQIHIFSRPVKSTLYGAQYLHKEIDGLILDPPAILEYKLEGYLLGYRSKVYGLDEVEFVSPELYLEGEEYLAWNLRQAYDFLWDMYCDRIVNLTLGEADVFPTVRSITGRYDLVLNTIPRKILCQAKGRSLKHDFGMAKIWAVGDAPDLGILAPVRPPRDTVIMNGDPDTRWYRASNIYDHVTVEWPGGVKPPLEGIQEVKKPTHTNCDCWTDELCHLGRYGKWDKSQLTHHAFFEAMELLEAWR